MDTAKIFKNGKSQAVRLPKKFRFKDGEEVLIKKVGEIVYLCPKDKAWENFLMSEPIDDDVWEAIEEARKNEIVEAREEI
ncbi:MAG: type II toxin-antitoxin system VapB family antitoxin [Oscillospiraceae bacterium]|nr:type II toxin-antitoxin system VapB family antitoxin [Oscillospiraceae bacterium]